MLNKRKSIDFYQAKYEQFVRNTNLSRRAYTSRCRDLENFLDFFPKKRFADDFHSLDIEDWIVLSLRQGKRPTTINRALYTISNFWLFMIDLGLPIVNPVSKARNFLKKEVPSDKAPSPSLSAQEEAWAHRFDEVVQAGS